MAPCLANFVFLVEMGFHHIGQAGLELLSSWSFNFQDTEASGQAIEVIRPPRPPEVLGL